ncbi:uncharacterized protein si:ch211-250c4.3 isoform X5 [Phyllopteryx taeniolatus]|uniref:uncharacterized protein si:ch211-250c4.3 isoform X5 n=1 Tax=Phyllopteryx taeniolatus TaxID=161469 RepID=UPI002AD4C741|nr:uncharacterized protein si:ch211-250c4.3 isoform X5 [Phyllopteryx taeniolatus]
MSVKRKKSGLIISWQKSFSILAPWRKGKGARDTVLDSAVVLTKMKLYSNFNERLSEVENFHSTLPAASEQKFSQHSKESLSVSHTDDKSGQHQTHTNADYLSDIFSGSQLTTFYKFESEDSGVELSSGNSTSTPTGSDQNFAVHSRESSRDSSNSNSNPPTQSDEKIRHRQTTDLSQPEVEISSPASRTDLEMDPSSVSPMNPGSDEEMIEKLEKEENFKPGKQSLSETYNNKADNDIESLKGSGTCDSFVKYMDKCCILSEDFFQHHCSCGAATLAFEDMDDVLSRSGTLADLSTIPEVSRHPLLSSNSNTLPLYSILILLSVADVSCNGWTPIPLRKRRLNRMSYHEGDAFLCESTEELSIPRRPQSDYDTWGRVKDLVKRTNMRNKSKLGLSTSSLKMSCPQLYRPDLGRKEPADRNRNSMIVLGHPNKLYVPWLQ